MLISAMVIALSILAVSLVLCTYRVIWGPTMADRILGLDAVTLTIMAVIVVLSVVVSTIFYNAVIIIAILSLVTSVALAKFLAGRRVL